MNQRKYQDWKMRNADGTIMPPTYSRDELLDALIELNRRTEGLPTVSDLRSAGDLPSYDTYRGRFGSWQAEQLIRGLRFL